MRHAGGPEACFDHIDTVVHQLHILENYVQAEFAVFPGTLMAASWVCFAEMQSMVPEVFA